MNNQDYEQKKRECFVQFCKDNGIDQEVNISIFDAFDQIFDRAFALGKKFGISDFSDAEGEEMLTVSRNNVMAYYRDAQEDEEEFHPAVENACNIMYQRAVGRRQMLKRLFGSKCLPDNVDSLSQNPPENCNKANHISTDDSKPAEPTDFGREVNFPTKNNPTIYLKKSKNCDNRLQIAAMAMQGILSNIDLFKNVLETGTETLSGDGISYRAVAKASLLFADALIAESEKRSGHGK